MNRNYVKKYKVLITILLLVTSILLINQIKPSFLYENNGSIRNFGIGFKSKTVIPLWLLVIVLSIFFYILIDFYIKYPHYVHWS
jgi:hypothetical protein